jgi:hypothetical protein
MINKILSILLVIFTFPLYGTDNKFFKGVPVNSLTETNNPNILSLNGQWKVKTDPYNIGLARNFELAPLETSITLSIPGSIQSLPELADEYPSAVGYQNDYLGTYWLEKEFELKKPEPGQIKWLKLGGILPAGHIWVNGHYIDYHNYGPVSTKWDITPYLMQGKNRLTIAIVEQETGLIGGFRFFDYKWSGVYRAVEIETTGMGHAEQLFINPDTRTGKVAVSFQLFNQDELPAQGNLRIEIKEWESGRVVYNKNMRDTKVPAKGNITIADEAHWNDPVAWTPQNPFLYVANIWKTSGDSTVRLASQRFGYRTIWVNGDNIYLNGSPLFIAGAGQEYFSPVIHPLTDRKVLAQRIKAMKTLGFNYFRAHTYPLSPEELEMADELGFLFGTEISLVSNFGKTTPFTKGMEVLKDHIIQTRNHPSLINYGLGNEGVQVMVNDTTEQQHAILGYGQIKRYAPGHLALISFGMQGELTHLPNDFETPHLWSDAFTWAYDGLTRIPWHTISSLLLEKPTVVHEFGKFGVWPDEAEDNIYPINGYSYPFGKEARTALAAEGLERYAKEITENSRILFDRFSLTVMEQARIQRGLDGYTMWTAFRGGRRNSGYADDMGTNIARNIQGYINRNQPIALLSDLGFYNRNLKAGIPQKIRFFVSNYGNSDIEKGTIEWEIRCMANNEVVSSGNSGGFQVIRGDNPKVAQIVIVPNQIEKPTHYLLSAKLREDSEIVAENSWDYWAYPNYEPSTQIILLNLECSATEQHFLDHFPKAQKLKDADSMIRGCYTWDGIDTVETIRRLNPHVIITDQWQPFLKDVIELGSNVVFYNTGSFPVSWFGAIQDNQFSPFDVNTSFSNFRAGWDQGNLGTVINPSPIMGDFIHDGYCDLHFYKMIQYAKPYRTKAITAHFAEFTGNDVIRNFPRTKEESAATNLQDPNAVAANLLFADRNFYTDDQVYLYHLKSDGSHVVFISMNMFRDIAGRYLLNQVIENIPR